MDAAKKKALFRAKLNAQKKDKRIDSPLVRYNEFDQPVCRVCDIVLKSESQWDAHQVSRKHREAINNIKANAAGCTHVNNVKPEPHTESTRPKRPLNADLQDTEFEPSTKLPKSQSSSALPPNFFDKHETKKQKTDTVKSLDQDSYKNSGASVKTNAMESCSKNELDGSPSGHDIQTKRAENEITGSETMQVKGALPEGFFDDKETDLPAHDSEPVKPYFKKNMRAPTEITGSEAKQVKGALPEGFFDNKEADLRARGIKLVKPDVKDEYKEFEKLIQEDLQEVDDRLEEEEIDAAEVIEEAESLEQKAYRKKVELLRKKKMELMAARSAKDSKGAGAAGKESSHEESSSDDDSDENFAVDWRAQHL